MSSPDLMPTSYGSLPHLPQVLHAHKFIEAARKFGYRVIHVPYDPCPQGPQGCVLCKNGRVGYHRRNPAEIEVTDVLRHARADKEAEVLSHRFRTAPVVIEAAVDGVVTELQEGEDFMVQDRAVVFTGRRPGREAQYTARYTAYAESWVNMQHAVGDFAGLKRQGEVDRFKRPGLIPEGAIVMSIGADHPGFELKQGDVFVPADGTVRTHRIAVAGRANNHGQYRFVHGVERAYWVDEEAGEEVDVAVTWDAARRQFVLPDDIPDDTRVAVIHRASPQYSVYLDLGEFRAPMAQAHQRLVVLTRLETTTS